MKEPKSLTSEFHENKMDPQGTLELLPTKFTIMIC